MGTDNLLYGQKSFDTPREAGTATAEETMHFIRDAVDNFLTCTACREHFLEAYDSCRYGRCEVLTARTEKDRVRRMVLWIWRVHNAVSMRVVTENHQRNPTTVDRRWPPYRDCPGCWRREVVLGNSDAAASEQADQVDVAFDLDRVFGYLLREYAGPENLDWNHHVQDKFGIGSDSDDGIAGSHSNWKNTEYIAVSLLCVGAVVLLLASFRTARGR